MVSRRHGQEGGAPAPSGNVLKCFCALVVTAKRPADELLCIIFTACRRLGLCPHADPLRSSIAASRWGTFVPRPLKV